MLGDQDWLTLLSWNMPGNFSPLSCAFNYVISMVSFNLNPICTGLFWCIRYRGGHIVPPLNIFGLGRVRVPILFGNYLPRSYLPYTKGFMKFGCPEPSKKVFDFRNFCSSKRRLTRFVRVPPYEILVFPTNFIFFQRNEITLRGKKCTALFQTHNWEKSSFFNKLVFVFAQKYANTVLIGWRREA